MLSSKPPFFAQTLLLLISILCNGRKKTWKKTAIPTLLITLKVPMLHYMIGIKCIHDTHCKLHLVPCVIHSIKMHFKVKSFYLHLLMFGPILYLLNFGQFWKWFLGLPTYLFLEKCRSCWDFIIGPLFKAQFQSFFDLIYRAAKFKKVKNTGGLRNSQNICAPKSLNQGFSFSYQCLDSGRRT